MRAAQPSLVGCIAAALVGLGAVIAVAALCGCVATPAAPSDPNAGLLSDFLDGKFDGAGHPFNAQVTEAESLCPTSGALADGALRLAGPCQGAIAGAAQQGDLIASARFPRRGARVERRRGRARGDRGRRHVARGLHRPPPRGTATGVTLQIASYLSYPSRRAVAIDAAGSHDQVLTA